MMATAAAVSKEFIKDADIIGDAGNQLAENISATVTAHMDTSWLFVFQ